MSASVLLLRAPSQDGSAPDKYEASFTSLGYSPISVPVLETVLVHRNDLRGIVRDGPVRRELNGVIVTSARACEAWKAVVEELVSENCDTAGDSDWSTVPFYVVGEATATALADIQGIPSSGVLAPRDIRGSAEGGTSEKLAHFILRDLHRSGSTTTLLYLTGDKNRDVLPKILQDGGIELASQQVYGTTGSSRFETDLEAALLTVPTNLTEWWIVFFAPSAAEFVAPILKKHFTLPLHPADGEVDRDVHLASIGPTTSIYLRHTLRLTIDVTAPKPNPEALAEAIQQFRLQVSHQ